MYKNLSPGAIGVRADTARALQLARANGFRGIDLSVGEAAQLGVERTAALFADAETLPGGWGLPVAWSAEEAKFQADMESLRHYADVAAQLGCTRCMTWIMPASDERAFDANWNFHVERFTPIARILADAGCRLGLEFIGPKTLRARFKHEFVYTMPEMLRMGAAIGPNVGLLLDCWHWYTSGGTVEDLRALTPEQVVYVHVNDAPAGVAVDEQVDNVRMLPGATGVIDITSFLQVLSQIGYDGPVTVEPFSEALNALPAEDAVRVTAEALDRVWRQAGLPA
jgi:sugar phosphate isomerase/epimerase